MLRALAALFVNKTVAWATIVVVVAATALLAVRAAHVERDDSLMAFLPQSNPDIKVFRDVNAKFGGLDVALVGVATDDPLAPELLAKLRKATKKLNETPGVAYAMSLTNFEDFTLNAEKGGIESGNLIPDTLPKTAAESAALREKVMSRDQAVGTVIAADGKAALIYCFLAEGNDVKTTAAVVRAVVDEDIPGYVKYWGGAPFMQSYIFGVTAEDLRRLTPWACVVIVLISVWAFRDLVGTLLALFTTAVGIVAALGLMGTFGVKTNLVLGSMPVILFALGSAYPIHILTRYYAVVKELGRDRAIEHVIVYLGPTVIASGLTAVSGLLSFMAMDMEPIRTFGKFTGIGVLVTLILSVTFVPAVIRVANLSARLSLHNHTSKGMIRFSTAMVTHRLPVGVGLVVLGLVAAVFVGRIDSRIDNSAFYTAKSEPALGAAFLHDHFGGSQFFQLYLTGDMNDPDVLREVRGMADRIAVLPHVSSVNHVGVVIAKINEAMEGDERVPDTGAKVKLLYSFLAGKQRGVAARHRRPGARPRPRQGRQRPRRRSGGGARRRRSGRRRRAGELHHRGGVRARARRGARSTCRRWCWRGCARSPRSTASRSARSRSTRWPPSSSSTAPPPPPRAPIARPSSRDPGLPGLGGVHRRAAQDTGRCSAPRRRRARDPGRAPRQGAPSPRWSPARWSARRTTPPCSTWRARCASRWPRSCAASSRSRTRAGSRPRPGSPCPRAARASGSSRRWARR